MPQYIVLRLTPPAAIGAGLFTTYLANLTVTAYDISYGEPDTGVLIGSASFLPPVLPPYDALTTIVQHEILGVLQSVATAVIEYVPPDPEYIAPDLLITFNWGGGNTVNAPEIYYDVGLYNVPPLAPAAFQGIADPSVSAFVTLPPPTTVLALPPGTTPPSFDSLYAMVTTVLAADPALPITPDLIAGLSVDQCRNIANEIVELVPENWTGS